MDFTFEADQLALRDLATQVFGGSVDLARLKKIEADGPIDRAWWGDLASTDLLGVCLPTEYGGSGHGMTELCLMLEAQGRALAPLPLLETIALGALPIAQFGSDAQRAAWLPRIIAGDAILTTAFDEPDNLDVTTPRTTATADGVLHGHKLAVPAGHVADAVLVPATLPDGAAGVFLVATDAAGVTCEVVATTDYRGAANMAFDGAPGEQLVGADVGWMYDRALVAIAALQLGVAREALRLTAEYVSGREQFGKPLSSFQGVALRAADAYINATAMDATLWQAAWRLDQGLDATNEITIAKWWAAEGGNQVVFATQHLHGGMGADIDYPIHRYFLWGKQLADRLGGASQQLARLGARIVEHYR